MDERDLIALFRPDVDRMDDCAFQNGILYTIDAMTEGTHFRLDWSGPEDTAHKLVHVNLSDIAASGGVPESAMLALGLPPMLPADFAGRFARTLLSELARFDVQLLGGDTYRSSALTLALWMSGRAEHPVLRSGGRAGDTLYVTGRLGGSYAGYRILRGELTLPEQVAKNCIQKHLRPEARTSWGRILAESGVHAMMDVSDGLVQDSEKLARASGLDLVIDLENLPVPDGIVPPLSLEDCAESGEELELLFLAGGLPECSFPVTAIGRAVQRSAAPSVKFRHRGTDILMKPGFLHFPA